MVPHCTKGLCCSGVCVASADSSKPPLSSALCIHASLVSSCFPKDCITLRLTEMHSGMWRTPLHLVYQLIQSLHGRACELRHLIFGYVEGPTRTPKSSTAQDNALQPERSAFLTSGRIFEAVASFKLIWWNPSTAVSQKRLSIWHPVLQPGMVYLGDIAVQRYEPPSSAIFLHDTGDEAFLRAPLD